MLLYKSVLNLGQEAIIFVFQALKVPGIGELLTWFILC